MGTGSVAEEEESKTEPRFWKRKPASSDVVVTRDLITPVPIRLVIEKLRGFVADHRAEIVSIDGNKVQMAIDDRSVATRRRSDRPLAFSVDLQFDEEMFQQPRAYGAAETRTISRTRIRVAVSPRKRRDRRRADEIGRASCRERV